MAAHASDGASDNAGSSAAGKESVPVRQCVVQRRRRMPCRRQKEIMAAPDAPLRANQYALRRKDDIMLRAPRVT